MATNTTARLADQVAVAAYTAGFRGQALVDWVAIALAESRGKIDAHGDQNLQDNKWGPSVGLWQVRSLHDHSGRWDGNRYVRDATRLTDPLVNARAAWIISNGGTNKRPWSVTHGSHNSYRNFLSTARGAVARMTEDNGRTLTSEGNLRLSRMRAGDYLGGTVSGSAGQVLHNAATSGTLRLGSRGEGVAELQRRLNERGGISVKVDGVFGQSTLEALRLFQRRTGLFVDGVAGAATLERLGMPTATSGWENRVGGAAAGSTPSAGGMGATIPGAGGNPAQGIGGAGWGGGGGIAQPSGMELGRELTEQELREYIAETYPQMLWALDNPELGPILRQAANEGWSAGRMMGKLIETKWWQENPESTRALQHIRHNDPATWDQMLRAKGTEIAQIARNLGIDLDEEVLVNLREQALLQNLSADQVRQQVVANWTPDIDTFRNGYGTGQASQIWAAMEHLPSQYLLGLSDADMQEWLKNIVSEQGTMESFQSYLRSVAAETMPFLKNLLAQGFTPQQALAPHRAQIAEMLEIDQEQVDFTKPRWSSLLTNEEDQLVSSSQMRRRVREQMPREWDNTDQARSMAMTMSQSIAEMFGRRA